MKAKKDMAPASKAVFEAALGVFQQLGATVRPIKLPPLRAYEDAKKTIAVATAEGHASAEVKFYGTIANTPANNSFRCVINQGT